MVVAWCHRNVLTTGGPAGRTGRVVDWPSQGSTQRENLVRSQTFRKTHLVKDTLCRCIAINLYLRSD